MWDLVGNPEDRFSHNEAHLSIFMLMKAADSHVGHIGVKGRMFRNQRTNGPVNAHLISWPSKAQNIQNLENIW